MENKGFPKIEPFEWKDLDKKTGIILYAKNEDATGRLYEVIFMYAENNLYLLAEKIHPAKDDQKLGTTVCKHGTSTDKPCPICNLRPDL